MSTADVHIQQEQQMHKHSCTMENPFTRTNTRSCILQTFKL